MNSLPAIAPRSAAPLPINSVQDMQTIGAILSQSQLFGQTNPAVGLAIVGMCHQKRMSWLDFMQTYHMIQGVVSKKTDAILADFHRMGGTHRVVSRTSDAAEAQFRLGDCEYISRITWEDCKSEPFIYVGKEKDVVPLIEQGAFNRLTVKAKYKTPRARMQMLWARCVSDGVRVVSPECVQGIYTPEETADFVPSASTPQPVQAVEVSSSSLLPASICPSGPLKGQRWADMETPVLQQALNGSAPWLTVEIKDHIRLVLMSRESAPSGAAQATAPSASAENEKKEVANA